MAGRAGINVGRVKDVKLVAEFKAFVMRGNVLDLAVGIVIGVAFGAVINSLVNDVIMPPVGLAIGGVDFKDSYFLLKDGPVAGPYASLEAATAAGAVTLRWGLFVNTLINFVIVAAAIFLVVKAVGRMRAKEQAAAPTEAPCPHCRMSIPLGAAKCGHCTTPLRAAGA